VVSVGVSLLARRLFDVQLVGAHAATIGGEESPSRPRYGSPVVGRP
jgi:hypothetical protein